MFDHYAPTVKIYADSLFKQSSFGPLKQFLFLEMTVNFDRVRTNQIKFRMGAIKGLFLPSLVHINPVVSIEKIKSKKMDDRHRTLDVVSSTPRHERDSNSQI
jgi:hypothetical protein